MAEVVSLGLCERWLWLLAMMLSLPFDGRCECLPEDPAYFGRLDEQAWKRLIEQIRRQQAGAKRAEGKDISWQQYCHSW